MIRSFQRTHRSPGNLSDILVFHILEISQREYNTLLLRQFLHLFHQCALNSVPVEIRVVIYLPLELAIQAFKGQCCPYFLFSQEVQRLVSGDSV